MQYEIMYIPQYSAPERTDFKELLENGWEPIGIFTTTTTFQYALVGGRIDTQHRESKNLWLRRPKTEEAVA